MAACVRFMTFAMVVLTLVLVTGCAGLSLFSSTHTHHYDTRETKARIEKLETRLAELERASASARAEE